MIPQQTPETLYAEHWTLYMLSFNIYRVSLYMFKPHFGFQTFGGGFLGVKKELWEQKNIGLFSKIFS